VLSSRIYPSNEAPRFIKGHSICAAFMFFTTILAITLRFLLVRDNKKLDREQGEVALPDKKSAFAAENYGPNFRYVL
jgi:hypothetical protein